MKITESCKTIFLDIMKKNNSDAIKIILSKQDSGLTLNMECVNASKSDRVRLINEIKIIMSEETEQLLADYTFDKSPNNNSIKLIHNCSHCN